ncbi:polar amino acid transport system permease protein [Mycoplana sp. BE70]|uniref:amino acid ABC transporter permease n=1 Tax=Mycoplana sp. BE70 TaxID=2817775 RepID=UPI00285F24A4|nr:amino acid ABC transporter permease [Mycoplana sp. BE70]MDR6755140.1 polar amino acid transport system permease protein [Mycoplana sp. BE70]
MIDYNFLRSLDFSVSWTYLPVLFGGLLTNILLTVIGFLCGGVTVGTVLALANLSPRRLVRWPALAFVEFWRSTPLLVQAIWIHFAVPGLTGVATTPFQSASIALIFNVAAYCSEIIRGGIQGVGKGQFEAAHALGMRAYATWRKVILPQAVRLMLPPLVGTIISIFKATAILSILAIDDLLKTASRLSTFTFQPVEIYTTAALLAFAVGAVISVSGYYAERALKRGASHGY